MAVLFQIRHKTKLFPTCVIEDSLVLSIVVKEFWPTSSSGDYILPPEITSVDLVSYGGGSSLPFLNCSVVRLCAVKHLLSFILEW